jgi:FAD/FMN-containing dehydrogenase
VSSRETDILAATLRAIVGDGHVLSDAELKASYETDWTRRFSGESRLVVRPATTDEVAAVMAACSAAGVAVVPQGGNTGLVGGGVPRGGEVLLSLKRLDAIKPVDVVAGQVTAGAGVALANLQDHVRREGFEYPIDLASRDSATIGGMVATNAGGLRVLRYGATRGRVIGIEAVTVDGRVLRRMSGLEKDNTGYDLAGLLTGSEGTLAVVTAARLRLVPQLTARAVALVGLDGIGDALTLLTRMRSRLPSLDAIEAFFDDGVQLVCEHTGAPRPFSKKYGCYLLIECAAQVDPTEELATALLDAPEIRDSSFATGAAERRGLWRYREDHTEAISAAGVPHKLDVTLPLSRMAEFERAVRERLRTEVPEARPILFGHLGDGNLHVNVLGLDPVDDRATDAVLRLVAEMDGSISAEHGVGVAKTRWLGLTRDAVDISMMRAVKRALDPKWLMNPGVIFDDED